VLKQVIIFGKRWRFVRKYLRNLDGFTTGEAKTQHPFSSSDLKKREIVISTAISGERELDVIIHEVLHAADWHRSEEWCATVATDLARILYRLGYRRDSE
jgi:hypothetical protein